MADYVYDGTTLPDGKTDLVPLTGTPSKHVTAAEWNSVMLAISDLRDAILTGNYHGLASDPAAAVSPATGVRLRSNAGVLEVSEAGAAYAPISVAPSPGEIYVSESPYNAVGDGVTDDTAALQAAFAVAETGKLIILEAGKTYLVTETIRLGQGLGAYVHLDGRGATIQRTAAAHADWAVNITYSAGHIRRRGEVVYECLVGGLSSPDADMGPIGYTTDIPWQASTTYTLGTERTNGGRVYIVTTAGTSASSGGPTGTGTGIADGTVVWRLGGISDNPPWVGETGYTVGQRRSNGANLYIVTTAGTSASSGGPTGTGTGIADGTVVWDYVSAITSPVVWRSISDAILEVQGNTATVKNLHIGAGRVATHGVWVESASQSSFENVDTYQPLFDGFKLFSNSDFVVLLNCQARISGGMWHTSGYAGSSPAQLRTTVTGTFAKVAGNNAVLTYTASGGSPITDLRKLGLRVGDFISLHATAPGGTSAEWLQVNTVDSDTQITCTQHPAAGGPSSAWPTMTGLLFSIHRGDGFHTGPGRAENNCHALITCRSDNSAGTGFRLGGLYGARCSNLLVNAAGSYPVVIATNSLMSFGTSIHGLYTEVGLNGAADNVFCGGAAGFTLDCVNGSGQPVISTTGVNFGSVTNMQDAGDVGRIDPIGTVEVNYIPSGVIVNGALAKGKIHGQSYASGTTIGGTYLDLDDRDYDGSARLMAGTEYGGGRSFVANCHELDTEIAVANGVAEAAWAINTAYTLGSRRANGGNVYQVTTAGTSAGAGGPTGTGTGITDNTVVWKYIETGTGIAADIVNKSLVRFRNNGVAKAGIGLEGEPRLATQNDEATPGAATNHMPSGSFAMAAAASTVVITNNTVIGGTAWAALTAYSLGALRQNNGRIYRVTTAGTSAASGGPTGNGTGIVDATVTWEFVADASKVFLSKRDNDATAVDFKVTTGLRSFTVTANAAATATVKFDFFIINPVNSLTA